MLPQWRYLSSRISIQVALFSVANCIAVPLEVFPGHQKVSCNPVSICTCACHHQVTGNDYVWCCEPPQEFSQTVSDEPRCIDTAVQSDLPNTCSPRSWTDSTNNFRVIVLWAPILGKSTWYFSPNTFCLEPQK